MEESRLNKALTVIFIGLFLIGIYHASTFIQSGSEIMISIYHISYNAMILSLMLFIYFEIRGIRKFKIHQRILKVSCIYFIYKILINIAYFFNPFVKFIEKHDTHVWSFSLTLLIIIILITIKYVKK